MVNDENCPPPSVLMDSMQLDTKFVRSTTSYVPKYQRFVIKKKTFSQQYSHIYLSRMLKLRPVVEQVVKSAETEVPILPKIIDLIRGQTRVLIGTLYKDMPLKPCILDEITEESTVITAIKDNIASEDDALVLEDESGRVTLTGNIPIGQLVTGVVIGACGEMKADDKFHVASWWTCGLPQQDPVATIPVHDEYVVLVSGLNVGRNKNPLGVQILVEYLSGRLGDEKVQEFVSKISRVIIAGNLVAPPQEIAHEPQNTADKKHLISSQAESLREVDRLLAQLLGNIHVDIMPGESDASNYAIPQQALHKCMFPHSSRFSSFNSVTNPYVANIGGREFLGSSGQPIDSIKQCSLGLSSVESLERTLLWRHIAPTAPDVLGCYPSPGEDPFVLESTPHVYFAGNQDKYGDSLMQDESGRQVRVISVPEFDTTGVCVAVNLKDLSSIPIEMSI